MAWGMGTPMPWWGIAWRRSAEAWGWLAMYACCSDAQALQAALLSYPLMYAHLTNLQVG